MAYMSTESENYYTKAESNERFAIKANGVMTGFKIIERTLVIESGTLTIDLSTANRFKVSLTEDITSIVVSNAPTDGEAINYVLETIGSGVDVSIDFSGMGLISDKKPSTGDGKKDIYSFTTTCDGTIGYIETPSWPEVNFKTMAEMRAYTPTSTDSIFNLYGYYSASDKKMVSYLYSSVLMTDDNGGSVIKPDSVGEEEAGRYYTKEAKTPKDFGAHADNSTDDTSFIQSIFDSDIKYIDLEGLNYKVSTLAFPSEKFIAGNGATITFTSTTVGANFKGMMRSRVTDLTLNSQASSAVLAEFGNDGTNDTYDNSFICVDFKGNSGVNTQIGLKMAHCYINTFVGCHILNFGINIQFETQANSNNFLSCSIRSNQTNNITLIRVLGGVANNFQSGDIENCVSWIDNGSATSVEDDTSCFFSNVYIEAMTTPSTLKYGSFTFDTCYISEPRFAIYGTSKAKFINNAIQKHGLSFIFYLMDSTISNLKIIDNDVEYLEGSEATTGLIYRGFPGVYQYVSNGNISSPTWANGTFSGKPNCVVEQSRIYNVNNGARISVVHRQPDYSYFGGDLSIAGNLELTASTSGMRIAGYQWNQGHLVMGSGSNLYHFWVYDNGVGAVTFRGKKGAPTYNADGTTIATIG